MSNNGGDKAASESSNMSFMQSPQGTFVPPEFKGPNEQKIGSHQDIQVKLIEHQIEVIPLNCQAVKINFLQSSLIHYF